MTRLHLILARSSNGVIGRGNTIPWHLPEDMAHFKQSTMGCPVIMGRKTWDSLPPRFKPLPGRRNLVVTRQNLWSADGATRADSLQHALLLCAGQADAWVIGGAQIYAQAMPLADSASITEIDITLEGDAFAPIFGHGWRETSRQSHLAANGLRYQLVNLIQEKGI
jgi:dihydrofolate reductase